MSYSDHFLFSFFSSLSFGNVVQQYFQLILIFLYDSIGQY